MTEGFITDITVVAVPTDKAMDWLLAVHELIERLGVQKIVAQSSGANVPVDTAIASLCASRKGSGHRGS